MAPRALEQDGICDVILYDGSEEEDDNDYSALARRTALEEIAPQNFMSEEAMPSTSMPSPHGPTAMHQYFQYVPQYLMTRMRSPLLVRTYSVARCLARYLTKTDSPPTPQRPHLHAIVWDHRIDRMRSSRSTANDTDDESNISLDQ